MKRVVIVEDEILVLMGIVSLFDSREDYIVTGKYTNPVKALDELMFTKPDILITDIKMPKMDGLTLIRKAKDVYPNLPIIVLTCYDDFKTVSSAFKLGVQDYLLKHEIDESNLFTQLDAIQTCRDREPSVPQQTSLGFTDFLNQKAQLPYTQGVCIVLIMFKKIYNDHAEPIPSSINLQWALNTVQEMIPPSIGSVFISGNKDIICILNADTTLTEKRNRIIHEFHRQLSTVINRPVIIIRSRKATSDSISEVWSELSSKRACIYYRTSGEILAADSDRCRITRRQLQFPDPLLMFSEPTEASWVSGMSELHRVACTERVDPSMLALQLLLYWNSVNTIISSVIDVQQNDQTPSIYDSIQRYDDTDMLMTWYIRMLSQLIRDMRSFSGRNHTIIHIKIYLHRHYQEHITLASLSRMFNLNEAYLSELFKRETGIGYLEFLTSIRLDHAKRLLRESEKTAEEIGFLTGFPNASHFSKTFKRLTGKTITEFREIPVLPEE